MTSDLRAVSSSSLLCPWSRRQLLPASATCVEQRHLNSSQAVNSNVSSHMCLFTEPNTIKSSVPHLTGFPLPSYFWLLQVKRYGSPGGFPAVTHIITPQAATGHLVRRILQQCHKQKAKFHFEGKTQTDEVSNNARVT